jgi:hypothetical protein
MNVDKTPAPDANSTFRYTYGTIKPYNPADAVSYSYTTTIEGLIQKYRKNSPDYELPEEIIKLYNNEDYGIYGDSTLHTCFLTTNDITGGNSGSPVINARGELIGLAFDGNWEAMSGDINYEPALQRCIAVDIRYVLFIIDKFANAQNLINEMKVVAK